jgi:hypothetical protein
MAATTYAISSLRNLKQDKRRRYLLVVCIWHGIHPLQL